MCYFIYVSAPYDEGHFPKKAFAGLAVHLQDDNGWLRDLHPHDRTFEITSEGCACRLYCSLSALVTDEETARTKLEAKLRRKYRKRKNPAGKVRKELEARLAKHRVEGGLSSEVVSCCQRFLESHDRLSLVVKWESGACDPAYSGVPESIEIADLPALAKQIREDVMYDIRRGRAQPAPLGIA